MICTLCPRNCRAERGDDEGHGVCGMGMLPRVARAALHMWEEPCISGTRGSGAVFFSGCALKCIFCQNEAISHGGAQYQSGYGGAVCAGGDRGAENIQAEDPDRI